MQDLNLEYDRDEQWEEYAQHAAMAEYWDDFETRRREFEAEYGAYSNEWSTGKTVTG